MNTSILLGIQCLIYLWHIINIIMFMLSGQIQGRHSGLWPSKQLTKVFYTLSISIIDGLYDILNNPKQLQSVFEQLNS